MSFCPELAAGFPVPRAPAEIVGGSTASVVLSDGGRVEEDNGTDVTDLFVDCARLGGAPVAAGSPSVPDDVPVEFVARGWLVRPASLAGGAPSGGGVSRLILGVSRRC